MEDKLRKLLKDIGEKDINFKSEFAREQVLSDILRIVNKENYIKFAEQQIYGFNLCHDGGGIINLVSTMGLTQEEYDVLIDKEMINYLDDNLKEEIKNFLIRKEKK